MKRVFLSFATMVMVVSIMLGEGYAYTKISGADANTMYLNNKKLIVVDVRDEIEYCPGHIPCAIHYSWNHGVFTSEYHNLPTTAPILLYCRSGSRSGQAAAVLDMNGYENVYSLDGGMRNWPGEQATCDDVEECDSISPTYFPHIASGDGWETEIAIINTSPETPLSGTVTAYNDVGKIVGDPLTVTLPRAGRIEMQVGTVFSTPELIRYLIFTPNTDQSYAYLKFYDLSSSKYRAAIPASTSINHGDIIISHITMIDGWWTGLSLVNTTTEDKTLTFTFNTKNSATLSLPAKAHKAINLADLLAGWQLDEINSAIISNAEGVIGLEIFGNGKQLSGILLRDSTTQNLYYPHITEDPSWWTGLVAYNPGNNPGQLTIKPYTADGTLLATNPTTPTKEIVLSPPGPVTPIEIGVRERYIGATSKLGLPKGTKWMAIESSVPVSGFELFGTTNNLQLAGYTSVGIDGDSGVFPKYVHQNDWTGIALINTTSDQISVTLTAYTDAGLEVASKTLQLNAFEQFVEVPQKIFDNSIDTATYIAYKATAPVVAFQINSEGNMLDALPGR